MLALLAAAHGGPALAVTAVGGLLALRGDLHPLHVFAVTAALFTGQLTIGWGNDLLDRRRDVAVGRTDKPLVTGALPVRLVVRAPAWAALACLVLSVLVGRRSALGLLLVTGAGHLYNLGLKSTRWSWAPYACASGTLPSVVALAAPTPHWAPFWMTGAGATLGVGAHLLNALPTSRTTNAPVFVASRTGSVNASHASWPPCCCPWPRCSLCSAPQVGPRRGRGRSSHSWSSSRRSRRSLKAGSP